MASGSSGRNNSPSKGFDFASDDILCSYEDYGNQDDANGTHSDPAILTNSNKEFNKSRMARSAVHPAPAYGSIDESSNHEMMTTIEKTMKKHSDNLMRFMEGLSSRLSQLELYCYNVDKSIGELRSDLVHDHGEQDSKLKSLEKHLQEVHRSVQVLRDKQELADTQKELAKLQLAQKESSDIHSHQNKDRPPPVQSVSSEPTKPEIMPDLQNQQLALALSHQVTSRPPEQHQHQHQSVGPPLNAPQTQPTQYYLSSQPIHAQFMPSSEPQYRANQPPQYQQWSTQQVITPQIRPQTANPGYTINPSPADTIPYGFNGPVRTVQSPPHPSLPPNTYVIYESEGGGGPRTYRPSQPTHFQQGGYAPTSSPIQNPQPNQMNQPGPPQFVRRQYGYIIDKTTSMGYRGDHIAAVIQRMEENGQPVDFNGVLDRLNGQQRG